MIVTSAEKVSFHRHACLWFADHASLSSQAFRRQKVIEASEAGPLILAIASPHTVAHRFSSRYPFHPIPPRPSSASDHSNPSCPKRHTVSSVSGVRGEGISQLLWKQRIAG